MHRISPVMFMFPPLRGGNAQVQSPKSLAAWAGTIRFQSTGTTEPGHYVQKEQENDNR